MMCRKSSIKRSIGNTFETTIMSKSPEGKSFALKNGSGNGKIQSRMPITRHINRQPHPQHHHQYHHQQQLNHRQPTITPQPSPTPKSTSQITLNEVVVCGTSPEWIEIKSFRQRNQLRWMVAFIQQSVYSKIDGIQIDKHALYTVWLSGYY